MNLKSVLVPVVLLAAATAGLVAATIGAHVTVYPSGAGYAYDTLPAYSNIHMGPLDRFTDHETGVVCYVYSGAAGGVSCIPTEALTGR